MPLAPGLRALRRHRGNVLLVLATMTLGLGGLAAAGTAAVTVLLRPLPYPAASALVDVSARLNPDGTPVLVSEAQFRSLRDNAGSVFSGLGEYADPEQRMLEAGSVSRPGTSCAVSAGLFAVLGVAPQIGAGVTRADTAAGVRAAVLSNRLWRLRLAANPNILGQEVNLDGAPFRIVGVMPAGFEFPLRAPADVWYALPAARAATLGPAFHVVARLGPGIILAGARSAVGAALARVPPKAEGVGKVIGLRRVVLGSARPALLFILAGSTCILAIFWFSVFTLTVALWIRRQQEVQVRMALGARAGQLVRQCVCELAWLSLPGTAGGIGTAALLLPWLRAALPPSVPGRADVALHWPVLVACAGVAAASVLSAGPLAFAAAERMAHRSRVQRGPARALVAGELLLAVPILVLGGFSAVGVTVLQIEGRTFTSDPGGASEFAAVAVRQALHLPWVRAAAISSDLPLDGRWSTKLAAGLSAKRPGPVSEINAITPGYFHVLGIPLLRGREFSERDANDSVLVVIVSRALAASYWPGQDPIGKVLWVGPYRHPGYVIGVVADTRPSGLLTPEFPEVYFLTSQEGLPWRTAYLLVRGEAPAGAAVPRLARIVRGLNMAQRPVFMAAAFPLRQVISRATEPFRVRALIGSAYAAILLLLTSLSIYGIANCSARAREQEFGVRIALGAPPASVFRLAVGEHALAVAAGLAGGCLLAYWAVAAAAHLYFGLWRSSREPWILALVLACVCSFAASAVAALRAGCTDPSQLLRR
ncbi:MAG TPA: ABC transporter permease [Terriglobales bacterium]|nr:ABC transporter permease [Terriglobales bacterium]